MVDTGPLLFNTQNPHMIPRTTIPLTLCIASKDTPTSRQVTHFWQENVGNDSPSITFYPAKKARLLDPGSADCKNHGSC